MSIELTPRELIEKYLNELVTGLEIEGELQTDGDSTALSTVPLLMSLHRKCSHLRRLTISNLTLKGNWLKFKTPWTSVRRLELSDVKVQCGKFEFKALHLDLPNIEEFVWVCSKSKRTLIPEVESTKQWLSRHKENHTKGSGPYLRWTPGPSPPDLSKCKHLQTVRLCLWIARKIFTLQSNQPGDAVEYWLKKYFPPGTIQDDFKETYGPIIWNRDHN